MVHANIWILLSPGMCATRLPQVYTTTVIKRPAPKLAISTPFFFASFVSATSSFTACPDSINRFPSPLHAGCALPILSMIAAKTIARIFATISTAIREEDNCSKSSPKILAYIVGSVVIAAPEPPAIHGRPTMKSPSKISFLTRNVAPTIARMEQIWETRIQGRYFATDLIRECLFIVRMEPVISAAIYKF